jgi:hypothetical protein
MYIIIAGAYTHHDPDGSRPVRQMSRLPRHNHEEQQQQQQEEDDEKMFVREMMKAGATINSTQRYEVSTYCTRY